MDEFWALREKIAPSSNDLEWSVGDVLNKGPHSLETLRVLRNLGVQVIRGNHEDKYIRYHLHELERKKSGKRNPMKLSVEECRLYHSLESEDIEFLFSLPIFLRMEGWTLIHAGVLPSTSLERLDKEEAAKVMRVRYLTYEGEFVHLDRSDPKVHFWWSELYDGRYGTIIYGHQPFLRPRIDRFSLGIDTGAVYGNRLTAAVFEDIHEIELIDVPSKAYAKRNKPWPLF